ncbi:hypothetical protein [Allorhodopirellula heiligendammensis]|nr:hypothetical protein [Allorhodopirellula heiligendammensis]
MSGRFTRPLESCHIPDDYTNWLFTPVEEGEREVAVHVRNDWMFSVSG